jgi:hypothetical protein
VENVSVIAAKLSAHFEENVVYRDQSFFCRGSYSLVEAKQLVCAGRRENTSATAAVTVVRVCASSNGVAYGALVEIIDSSTKLLLGRAEFKAKLCRHGSGEDEEMAKEDRR